MNQTYVPSFVRTLGIFSGHDVDDSSNGSVSVRCIFHKHQDGAICVQVRTTKHFFCLPINVFMQPPFSPVMISGAAASSAKTRLSRLQSVAFRRPLSSNFRHDIRSSSHSRLLSPSHVPIMSPPPPPTGYGSKCGWSSSNEGGS
ncbi:hypothetical protein T11_17533 [Trichinella zimbabwensis]|uniref:Uncharacterized protein n=1 Tax=Trichinella zimbabwensis TaxID=268475 RepID=A0A0V1I5D3_9BILA|nr:hypothetical protein T11_17533 [Trichinella zimbabwensis]